MKYHRKITITAMILLIVAFIFSNKNYIFNKQNAFGGFVFISTTLKVWNEKSPADYNFCPVLTYTNNGDKFVTYYKRLEDKKGNNYFVSQPPFSNILAYFFISALQLPFDFASIKILSLVVLVAGSIFAYLIVNLITQKKLLEFSISALIAMAVFLFIPVNNYSIASTYAPELVFCLSAIFFYLLITLKRSGKILHFILLGLSVFVVSYTDWIGVFISLSILFYCVLHYKDKLLRKVLIYVLVFTGLSMLLTYIQYSSLNGTAEMIHAMKIRFLGRSGWFGAKLSEHRINIYSLSSWIIFFKTLNLALIGFGYLMFLLTGLFLFIKKKVQYQQGLFKLVFFSIVLPLIAHFIILFNSNAIHHCYMAKISVPVSILLGLMFNLFNQNHLFGYKKAIMLLLLIITAILSHFILLKSYPLISDFSIPVKQGKLIHENALPDEAVFISRDTTSDFFADYFLSYLSDRNLRCANGKDNAIIIAQQLGKTKGVYFELNADTSLIKAFHFKVEN